MRLYLNLALSRTVTVLMATLDDGVNGSVLGQASSVMEIILECYSEGCFVCLGFELNFQVIPESGECEERQIFKKFDPVRRNGKIIDIPKIAALISSKLESNRFMKDCGCCH